MEECFKNKNKQDENESGGATVGDMCMARNLFKFGKKTQTMLRYQSNKECLVERMPVSWSFFSEQAALRRPAEALPEGEITEASC